MFNIILSKCNFPDKENRLSQSFLPTFLNTPKMMRNSIIVVEEAGEAANLQHITHIYLFIFKKN